MKSSYFYSQPNHLTSRVVIAREQKQFIKIAFAVHLSAVISAERYRSDSGALKSAVLNFVFFVMLKNKIEQSAKTKLLLNSPTDRTFENRRGKYKELGKKVPQAYRVYVEETFLPCDAVIARIFSKEMTHTENQGDNDEQKAKRYYYHSDHLGSAQFVTDWRGKQYEHIEYTPYGELWIEEVAAGLDKLPFRFTGKELDEETGLYYYGARYLDPKYSRWLSGDPALNDYIPSPGTDPAKLAGMGGVYNTVNLHVYHYAGNNPIKYTDPTGKNIIEEIARKTADFFEKDQTQKEKQNRESSFIQYNRQQALDDKLIKNRFNDGIELHLPKDSFIPKISFMRDLIKNNKNQFFSELKNSLFEAKVNILGVNFPAGSIGKIVNNILELEGDNFSFMHGLYTYEKLDNGAVFFAQTGNIFSATGHL